MAYKTIYQMTLNELQRECESRGICCTGTKDDLLVILEQRLRDDGFNSRSALFPVSSTGQNSVVVTGLDQSSLHNDDFRSNHEDGFIDDDLHDLHGETGVHGNRALSAARSRRSNCSRECSRTSSPGARSARSINIVRQKSSTAADLIDAGAQVRREVELFGLENRLESVEIALVDIRKSLRTLNSRQLEIERRLDSRTCTCGNVGNGQSRHADVTEDVENRHNIDSQSRMAELHMRLAGIEREVRETAFDTQSAAGVHARSPIPESNANSRKLQPSTDYNIPTTHTRSQPVSVNCDREARDFTGVIPISSTRVGAAPISRNTNVTRNNDLNTRYNINAVRFDDQTAPIDSNTRSTVHQNTSTSMPTGSMYTFKLTPPPQFAGKKYEDPNSFIINSEVVLRNSGIHESDWVRLIGEQLSDAAASWYKLIKSMGLTWTEFREEFSDRWDSPALRSQLTTDIMSTRQRPGQALTDFFIYKINLVRRIGLQLPEQDVIDIIVGLVHDELGALIRLSNPCTFRDLRRVAKNLDGSRYYKSSGPEKKVTYQSQAKIKNEGGTTPSMRPSKKPEPICVICSGAHYANKCPNRTEKSKSVDSQNSKKSGNDKRADKKSEKSSRK